MDRDDAPCGYSNHADEGFALAGSGQAGDARLHSLREKRLREENIGLRGQLDSARGIIESVARGAVPGDDSGKRSRIGTIGGDRAGSSSYALQGDEDNGSHHPATLRAERLRVELEEQRVLREQDKLRFEVLLREAENTKGKLLRQVKFLSQEEEETRAECDKKQAALLAETARLQKSLGAERAALAEVKAEDGQMSQQERQAFERRLAREAEGRRAAQERKREFREQAEACAEELAESRRQRRVVDAKNVSLSLEVAKLKREAGTAASVPAAEASGGGAEAGLSPAWDTPEARELRAKIRTLEREARKKEAVLKAMEDDRRNAVALEDEVQTLQGALQRAQEALKSALEVQAENGAISDEKEEWSMLFARAVREENAATRFKLKAKEAGGGGGEGEGGGAGGERAGPRPTPVVALRLLREVQDERSLAVKELTALRLRHDNNQKCLVQVELELKKEKERADSLDVRTEDLQSEFDQLERRCLSAEREVAAQKELIESYERDNFRKPADEAWLSGHAALQEALAAAKGEVEALREAAEGQVSDLEARRLRDRAAEAEAELAAVVKERDQAVKAAEEYGDKLAVLAKEVATGTGAWAGKVLHVQDNPLARAVEAANKSLKEQVEALKADNKRLVHQLEQAGPGAVDASMSMMEGVSIIGGPGMRGADTPDATKFSVRLKETYKERINYYREAVYLLTGYRIDLMKDPTRQVLRLRSMYAEHESDCLLFQQNKAGLELVETPLALQHMEKIDIFLSKCHSIPAFLSSLTTELFEKQTFMPS